MTTEIAVPPHVHPAYDAIVKLADVFCQTNLTPEFQDMCRQLAGVLAQNGPSPMRRGKPEVWACGILRVIGRVNFLDLDTGRQPSMKLTTIDKRLGVSSNTGQSKAKAIQDLLGIQSFDLKWTVPSLRHPAIRQRMLAYSPEFFGVLDRDESEAEKQIENQPLLSIIPLEFRTLGQSL